jgi:hypothetical protein
VAVTARYVLPHALTNLLYRVIRKPTELLFFVGNGLDKEFLDHVSSAALVFRPSNCLPPCPTSKSLHIVSSPSRKNNPVFI